MTLTEFCDVANVETAVRHTPGATNDWIADMKNAEYQNFQGEGVLRGICGFGRTPIDALANMVKDIRGKWLVINAYCDARRELQIPQTLEST